MNVLVVGGAKTGTTVISRTIHNSIPNARFHMEPSDLELFMQPLGANGESQVVKIIFEHWNKTPHFRRAMVANELPFRFDKTVLIIRDPRDEVLSRIMYFIYPWMTNNGLEGNEEKVFDWIRYVKAMEVDPSGYGLLQLVEHIKTNYGIVLLRPPGHGLKVYRNFCVQSGKDLYQLKYEDFIEAKVEQLEAYLGFPLAKESGMDRQDRTRRSATYNNWKQLFVQEDLDFFKTHLGDLMERQGYDDWELEQVDHLPAENYSGYLCRLCEDFVKGRNKREGLPRSTGKDFLESVREL